MIPRIIHQSWKVAKIPDRWLGFQETWRNNHPHHDYHFWTDDSNRDFVSKIFPEFLPVYDGYRHGVSRADLARYLVVSHYGGIYVDLDCESLRPLDDLLAGRTLVFGLEPQSHVAKPAVASRGFRRIIGNALFASEPRHPFVLTRACDSYPRPQELTILSSEVFYPLDHFLQSTEPGAKTALSSYSIHHWAGTWWRDTVLNNAWHRIVASRGERKESDGGHDGNSQ
jgi:mannosyltransferase OCH1-like enzyme